VRILFVLPRIVSGGVERVTLNLIRQFAADGVECTLALRRAHGELLYEAHSLVRVVELAPNGLHQFVPGLSKLIRAWHPSHIITAFPDVAFMTWMAMRMSRSDAFWVHGVHNSHASIVARKGVVGKLRHLGENRIAGFVYRNSDATVAVSDGVRDEVLEWSGVDPARVVTIHNPIVTEGQLRIVAEPRHAVDEPFSIVAIGRLVRQKGFDILIRAMAKVPQPWRLDIWGEGPERDQLTSLIASHGLESMLQLRGYTDEPFEILRRADLFVLSSRHEGLPTVLVEALACQCQIVATECMHGPKEILLDGNLGRLVHVEDIESLADAIESVCCGRARTDPRSLLMRAGDFTTKVAYEKWCALLQGQLTVADAFRSG
jgi:glycosyltransferase involved in cell wall biosynthesis